MTHYIIKIEVVRLEDGQQPCTIEARVSQRRVQNENYAMKLATALANTATQYIDNFNRQQAKEN